MTILELRECPRECMPPGLDDRLEARPNPAMLEVLGVRRPDMIPVTGGGTYEFLDEERVAREGRCAGGGSGRGNDGGFTSGADDNRRTCTSDATLEYGWGRSKCSISARADFSDDGVELRSWPSEFASSTELVDPALSFRQDCVGVGVSRSDSGSPMIVV